MCVIVVAEEQIFKVFVSCFSTMSWDIEVRHTWGCPRIFKVAEEMGKAIWSRASQIFGILGHTVFCVLPNERKLMRSSLGRLEVIFDGGQAYIYTLRTHRV